MASFTKIIFSQSENGRGIAIAATSSPGTLIHTSTAGATDEVWLNLSNTTNADIQVTVEIGGSATADRVVEVIPAKSGMVPVALGSLMTAGNELRAFAAAPGINAFGYVNRF